MFFECKWLINIVLWYLKTTFLVVKVNTENAFPLLQHFGHVVLNCSSEYKSFFDLDDSLRALTSPYPEWFEWQGAFARVIISLNSGSQSTKSNTVKWMAVTSIHSRQTPGHHSWTFPFLTSYFQTTRSVIFLSPKSYLNAYTSLHPQTHHPS